MFLDNRRSLCSGTRATLLHLSLRSCTSIRHRVFQGYPISSWQKSIPGPWDRPSINSGGRNMGQPPELTPPSLSAQHKVNELTTFPPTSSNQQPMFQPWRSQRCFNPSHDSLKLTPSQTLECLQAGVCRNGERGVDAWAATHTATPPPFPSAEVFFFHSLTKNWQKYNSFK